ncbi:NAD(P)-dependent oxidoreductase [Nocardia sp. XZ_19_385]|uniref:NAD(P)-dependent oxidoreductase n=1 Tax=Nocardia sp. XZ_19_385 TaxID=2769488 RepID=UPI00188E21D5|nr:NAD(P)H-binding protein [Nocardia sp. XZ_19_385]
MRITVFGAAGEVGSRVVAEALTRGHEVTAVVRDLARAGAVPTGAQLAVGDASVPADIERLSTGQDLVITATRPPAGSESDLVGVTAAMLQGLAGSDVRLLVVGGAATLTVPGGVTLHETPGFPAQLRGIAQACSEQLDLVRAATHTDWTYLSPPAELIPGHRTGDYRLGRDELLTDDEGVSTISMEDFAVALLDEAEQPAHRRTRFTVAAA